MASPRARISERELPEKWQDKFLALIAVLQEKIPAMSSPVLNELNKKLPAIKDMITTERKDEKKAEAENPSVVVTKFLAVRDALQLAILDAYIDLYVAGREKGALFSIHKGALEKFQKLIVENKKILDILNLDRKKTYGKTKPDSKILNTMTADPLFKPAHRDVLTDKIFKKAMDELLEGLSGHSPAEHRLGFINCLKAYERMHIGSKEVRDFEPHMFWNWKVDAMCEVVLPDEKSAAPVVKKPAGSALAGHVALEGIGKGAAKKFVELLTLNDKTEYDEHVIGKMFNDLNDKKADYQTFLFIMREYFHPSVSPKL